MNSIWIAKYHHRHGEDISVHTTRAGALRQVAAWAREWLKEYEKDDADAAKMRAIIANPERHEELVFEWIDYTNNQEDFNLEQLAVKD
jgi:uncharacterized protein YbaA (DUF1428 family)